MFSVQIARQNSNHCDICEVICKGKHLYFFPRSYIFNCESFKMHDKNA